MIPDLRNWRDVPMPPAVESLPRDKRGFPIPWVAEWDSGTMRPKMEKSRRVGYCSCTIGEGPVNLGAVCPTRQREGMAHRKCGVCGDALGKEAVFMGHLDNETYTEPPVHMECGLYAAQVCPGLITPNRVEKTGVCITKRWDIPRERGMVPPGVDKTWPLGGITAYGGVVMMLVAEPTGPRQRLSIDEFLEQHLATTKE